MPSPVGHALGGLTVHLLTARDRAEALSRSRALVVVAAAIAPDFDLLLRFVDGQNHHQGLSHSLGAAVGAGAIAALAALLARAVRPLSWGLSTAAGWTSHLVLDYLGHDTHPPIGFPALWPLSDAYLKFPWPLFFSVGRTLDWAMVRNNTIAVAWELIVLLPPTAWLWRRRVRTA
jgi:membrane-bound metal-dependent hydrolase YbcI (DUF457 family)